MCSAVFRDFKILSGSLFFNQMIFPSAGLSTSSSIGIPSCQIIGQQTPPGKGNTHGTVNKCFHFQFVRNVSADLPDLFHGGFPG